MAGPLGERQRVTVGVDVVEVARIARLLERHERAKQRLFSDREIAYCDSRRRAAEHFAARFAAKEAVFKALGCGLRDGLRWRDVEVVSEPNGRPAVCLDGAAAALAEQQGLGAMEISLTHAAGIAIAQVVALGPR